MKQAVALVLSSGGARGLAHIGVIEELEQAGFEIKSVAGTSMGALVGGAEKPSHHGGLTERSSDGVTAARG